MNFLFTEHVHPVKGLAPSADLYNGNPATDIINMKESEKLIFVLHQKTGGTNTGNAVVKVEAVDNVVGSNATLVPFKYRKMTTGASDALGAVSTAVAANGFTTTANEDTAYFIEIDARDLPSDQQYVRMTLTESTNDPVLGSVMGYLVGKRYGVTYNTALT